MSPISFTVETVLSLSAAEIAREFSRVDQWGSFTGSGIVPGIVSASYEYRTPEMTGSRIRVQNEGGSSHLEEIVAWVPNQRIALRFGEFTPPLDRLADHFTEEWRFYPEREGTRVARSFELHPKGWLGRLLLRLVARFLEEAVRKHLDTMKALPHERDRGGRSS